MGPLRERRLQGWLATHSLADVHRGPSTQQVHADRFREAGTLGTCPQLVPHLSSPLTPPQLRSLSGSQGRLAKLQLFGALPTRDKARSTFLRRCPDKCSSLTRCPPPPGPALAKREIRPEHRSGMRGQWDCPGSRMLRQVLPPGHSPHLPGHKVPGVGT